MLVLSLVVTGCGQKQAPAPAVDVAEEQAPVAEAPPAEEEAEEELVEEEPAEPPPPADNADLQVGVTFVGGETRSGHVKRVERSTDWWGEEDWTLDAGEIQLTLQAEGTEVRAPWSELKSITVAAGSVPSDVDCTYSSEMNPWIYTCELKTPTTAVTVEGKRYTVQDRQRWRFVFDDDSELTFWLKKWPARQQDETVTGLGGGENYDMYAMLQQRLRDERAQMVKSISISR